jgi:Ni,Fe-hydrogenase III large subunit
VSSRRWWDRAERLGGALPARRLTATDGEWQQCAADVAAAGGCLVALWAAEGVSGAAAVVRAAFAIEPGVLIVELAVDRNGDDAVCYPGLESLYPCASRMQRAVFDLGGLRSTDPDRRPWLRHAAWPAGLHPLREAPGRGADERRDEAGADPAGKQRGDVDRKDGGVASVAAADDYAFVRVQGEGVHEIPVGPVHAGIIEPGHFRFSVVGEKVLRLEERLGYVHKGIERRFCELALGDGHRLAARVSGDSAVAYSWAYCQALEGLAGCVIPSRASWLRGLALEVERIANHLGDLGALGNDAGFAFGLAQFSRLKEHWLRTVSAAFGQRYLFDAVVPGGMGVDVAPDAARALAAHAAQLARQVRELRRIYEEHDGVRDRFAATGCVAPELAARLGLVGLAGRASGHAFDVRVDWPCAPYYELMPSIALRTEGDVAARVAVRFDELGESCRLVARIAGGLPGGSFRAEIAVPAAPAFGVGVVEGWRGPVLVALDAGPGGRILRCHPHDPSWQNWPALEHAIIGNIVPDFPLINKSFNLSYSGHDL